MAATPGDNGRDDEARDHALMERLRAAVGLACTPQNTHRIAQGRADVLALPREWVLRHLQPVATQVLDLSDYWEYRRLLELARLLDTGLTARLVAIGIDHDDPDVREAAGDFRD